MTLEEAIEARHSVRKYIEKPLQDDVLRKLQDKIEECNRLGNLNIQLVLNEKKAFTGMLAYGKFFGVENYLVIVGKSAPDLDLKAGYYGEQLVLLAQTLGLNTCWVGLSYRQVHEAYKVAKGEKLVCMISIGYGETQGVQHKMKGISQISNAGTNSPEWFIRGVKAALLAPTAINQTKFSFEYVPAIEGGKPRVIARSGFSLAGYTKVDLGIAKLHFEIAAGTDNFDWAE